MSDPFQTIFGAHNDGLIHSKLTTSHRFLHSHSSPSLFNDHYNLIDDFYFRMQSQPQ